MSVPEIQYGDIWDSICCDNESIHITCLNGQQTAIPNDRRLHNFEITNDLLSQLSTDPIWLLKFFMINSLISSTPPVCSVHQASMNLSSNKRSMMMKSSYLS